MKLLLSSVLLAALAVATEGGNQRRRRMTQNIDGEKRIMLFSSRRMEGECTEECKSDYVAEEVVQIIPNPTDTPETPAPTEDPNLCPYHTLDFAGLERGAFITDQLWWDHGVKITAIRKSTSDGYTPIDGVHNEAGGGAIVFDTSKPEDPDNGCAGDPDLGSPNKAFGGPGLGAGGGRNSVALGGEENPFKNDVALGNVLVIQESDDPGCPNDSKKGGYIAFDFRVPVDLKLATLLDIDNSNSAPNIKVWYGDGQIAQFKTTDTGSNGVWTENMNLPAVTKVEFEFFAFGSISSLEYRFCTPDCPLQTWNFNDLVPGTYIRREKWDERGVKVTAKKSGEMGYTPIDGEHVDSGGGAMVFDTLHPTYETGQDLCGYRDAAGNRQKGNANDPKEGDPDLGAPNEHCTGGGPGEGPGGAPLLSNGSKNPYANCEPLGNVLVIQEKDKPCPDDSGTGGYIRFDFKDNAYVHLAKLLDIDNNEDAPLITLKYADDTFADIKTSKTLNNGLFSQPIMLENIKQVKITYFGSGSIAELQYSQCPPSY